MTDTRIAAARRPVYVFLGTKAQYIKTMPVLRRWDAAGVPYRLIDSGQHADFAPALRRELGIRAPDVTLASGGDIKTVREVVAWFLRHVFESLVWPRRMARRLFPQGRGICLIHGDTPSTLLALLMARRAGQRIAHIEAGLRSFHWLKPFPEELIRVLCMHWSHDLFVPSEAALNNLRRMRIRGKIIETGHNTGLEAMHLALQGPGTPAPVAPPYPVITVHRVETLLRRGRLDFVVRWVRRLGERGPVVFVLHEPTRKKLEQYGLMQELRESAAIRLLPLQPYPSFIRMLAQAEFVWTDGGSIQEECAYLGMPCLILREHTERGDGLDSNARLARFEDAEVERFLQDLESLRGGALVPERPPSSIICTYLGETAGAQD